MLCRIKTLKLYQYKFSFYRKYEIAKSQELKIAVSSETSKCKDVFNKTLILQVHLGKENALEIAKS